MKKINLLTILILYSSLAFAESIKVAGLYYNLIKGNYAEVTSSPEKYKGDISIPNSIEYEGNAYKVIIGEKAFAESEVTSVIIADGITSIGSKAFYSCMNLESVSIPNSVVSINSSAFFDCVKLSKVNIPECIDVIDYGVFENCRSIENIDLPNCLIEIKGGAFNGCTSLKTISIPSSVKIIGNSAFKGCESIESVNITDIESWCQIKFGYTGNGDNPLEYGHHLFVNGEELKTLIIPEKVETLHQNFIGCTDLNVVVFHNNFKKLDGGTFWGCTELKEVVLPNSVIEIGGSDFRDCVNLKSVTLGNGIHRIGWYAFGACRNIEDFYCKAVEVPQVDDDTFINSYVGYATLHVPAESVEQYKTHSVWGKFGNIVALTDTEMSVETPCSSDVYSQIYTLDGVKHNTTQKGLNIIRFENGAVKRVFHK